MRRTARHQVVLRFAPDQASAAPPPPPARKLWTHFNIAALAALVLALGTIIDTVNREGALGNSAVRWGYGRALRASVQQTLADWTPAKPVSASEFVDAEVKQLSALWPEQWPSMVAQEVETARRRADQESLRHARFRADILLEMQLPIWCRRIQMPNEDRADLELAAADVSLLLGDLALALQHASKVLGPKSTESATSAEEAWARTRAYAVLAQVDFWMGAPADKSRTVETDLKNADTSANAIRQLRARDRTVSSDDLADIATTFCELVRAQLCYDHGDLYDADRAAADAEKACSVRTLRAPTPDLTRRLTEEKLRACRIQTYSRLSMDKQLGEQEAMLDCLERSYEGSKDAYALAIVRSMRALCALKRAKGSQKRSLERDAAEQYREARDALEKGGFLTDMVWPLDEECYPNCDLNRLEATSACIARLEAIYLRCGNVIAHGLACHDAAKLYEKLKAREHAVAKCRDAIDVWTRVGHCQRLTYSSFLEGRILNEWAADTPQGPLRATHLGDAWKALQAADDANQKCCEERGVEKGQFGIWILQQQASTKELAGHWADAEHLHAKILQKCKDVRKSLGSEYSEDPGDYYRSELSDYEAKARFGQQRARASAGRRHS